MLEWRLTVLTISRAKKGFRASMQIERIPCPQPNRESKSRWLLARLSDYWLPGYIGHCSLGGSSWAETLCSDCEDSEVGSRSGPVMRTALLLTSRQIYQEAIEYLYRVNTITLYNATDLVALATTARSHGHLDYIMSLQLDRCSSSHWEIYPWYDHFDDDDWPRSWERFRGHLRRLQEELATNDAGSTKHHVHTGCSVEGIHLLFPNLKHLDINLASTS